MRKVILIAGTMLVVFGIMAMPVLAQGESGGVVNALSTEAIALAVAAAGCGYAQSQAVAAGCRGVSRNPGSSDTVRFFIILGLAFIEFLALLVFLFVAFINN